jgi:hypothetical protein
VNCAIGFRLCDAKSYENLASFSSRLPDCLYRPLNTAPVIPITRKIQVDFPELEINLVVDKRIYGTNYKVCNLINACPLARHDLIIVCDSDIRVGDRYLREVCAPFTDPRVGLVTSLYRSSEIHGAATAIEAMGFTAEMVPNVMVALKLEGLSFALGADHARFPAGRLLRLRPHPALPAGAPRPDCFGLDLSRPCSGHSSLCGAQPGGLSSFSVISVPFFSWSGYPVLNGLRAAWPSIPNFHEGKKP